MPSPFPGMDPYIEAQAWEDFHARWNLVLSDSLVPRLRPRYYVRVERRVFLERMDDDCVRVIVPDAVVAETLAEPWSEYAENPAPAETATATMMAPVRCRLPRGYEKRETFLTIRDVSTNRVVTVIETLSPENKRVGSVGRSKYLRKRRAIIESTTHLVEFDLLRGGQRLPMVDPLPAGDYFAIVSRGGALDADVYAWPIRRRLPIIPIPLAKRDPDVPIDLQEVFTNAYDRAGYDYTLDYRRPPEPAPVPIDAKWIASVLDRRQGAQTP